MPQILVIADDFTGAAEIGGIAHCFGLSVRVVNEFFKAQGNKEQTIIIDTNSRRLPPLKAFKRIKTVLADVDLSSFDLIYKKVDSVIRGPIESEIKAVISVAGFNTAIIMPANPSRGRTINNGKYFIDGIPISETDFLLDPEYPRTSDEVVNLIVDATEDLYVGDPVAVDVRNKIIVPDVRNSDSFRSVIKLFSGEKYLPAGGADFFRSLLQNQLELLESRNNSYNHPGGKRYFIIGSKSNQSNLTISYLVNSGFSGFYLPERSLDSETIFSEWLKQIRHAILNKKKVFIARPEIHISNPQSTNVIIKLLARAAHELISNCSPDDEIFIEGGETASTIIRNLDNTNLGINEVIADGVVKLEIEHKGIYLIVKPGSYRWSKNIINTIKHDF